MSRHVTNSASDMQKYVNKNDFACFHIKLKADFRDKTEKTHECISDLSTSSCTGTLIDKKMARSLSISRKPLLHHWQRHDHVMNKESQTTIALRLILSERGKNVLKSKLPTDALKILMLLFDIKHTTEFASNKCFISRIMPEETKLIWHKIMPKKSFHGLQWNYL